MALTARMGLKTAGLVREQIIKLLKWLYRNKHNVHHVKTNAETYNLFIDTHRPPRTVDKIRPLAFVLRNEPGEIIPDVEKVLRRLGVNFDRIEDDGVACVDVCSWIFDDEDMVKSIDMEFCCFEWHAQDRLEGGWLPHMTHSIIQQLISQDPVIYTLFVAMRPNNPTELISLPFPAQFILPGTVLSG